MKKTKTKRVSQPKQKKKASSKPRSTSPRPKRKSTKHFHVKYLAALVVVLLLLEGLLFTRATAANWQEAVSILNLKPALEQTQRDLAFVAGPYYNVYKITEEFYLQAANAVMPMLDLNDSISAFEDVWSGVNKFYTLASVEMEDLLQISGPASWQPQVAGFSLTFE